MNTSIPTAGDTFSVIRVTGLVVAWIVLAGSLLFIGSLAYSWSFTDTAFGGYLGVILPVLLGICCFAAGVLANHFSGD